ncbi:MAG: type II toxin-antitoxin system VapC family toxin [Spirochaetaceae bacterium]|nr:type II toxin-antitoxin system VapC family toxin [Spirochaetaceae bacterium]
MIYMFDTDTVSFFMKDNPKGVRIKAANHDKDEFCISAITYAELMLGLKRSYSKELYFWLHEVLCKFRVIAFDVSASEIYGDIRTVLEKSENPLDNMDMLIAASAIVAGATLVSRNTKHFSKIKGLKVEDWT